MPLRGGSRPVRSLDSVAEPAQDDQATCDLDESLRRLEGVLPRAAQVVTLRYFAGLELEETARALDISSATVRRDWDFARAWLLEDLSADPAP